MSDNEIILRECKICKEIKSLTDEFFYRDRGLFKLQCKVCVNAVTKIYREKNKEKLKINKKIYYNNNKEKIIKRITAHAKNNKQKTQQYVLKYYNKNKEKISKYRNEHKKEKSEYDRLYREKNIDKRKKNNKEYYEVNKVKILKKQKEYYKTYKPTKNKKISSQYIKNKYKTNVSFRLRRNISASIRGALVRKGSSKRGGSIIDYLPYSIQELKEYLESLFEPWMNWNNWGKYNVKSWNDQDSSTWTWNIDHIIPQVALPYISMSDLNFQKCWALENLRPYSAKQNILDNSRNM